MDLNLGACFLRFYSGANWTHLELGVATRRNGGLARRETALRLGLKSTHALELFSVENPADRFIAPDGSITYGRICIHGNRHYSLSAEEIFSGRLYDQALQAAVQRVSSGETHSLSGSWSSSLDGTPELGLA